MRIVPAFKAIGMTASGKVQTTRLREHALREFKLPGEELPVSARTLRQFSAVLLSFWAACSSVLADEYTDRKIAESALRETRDIISRDLFGHYDISELQVLKTEDLRGRISSQRDYGLVRATMKFSARRNTTRSPSLNPALFEPGNAACQDWLYLHCGVPVGHAFEGNLELLLAVDGGGSWRAVSPKWRSRRQYSLDGYLLLEGREKEGYVLFPKR